MAMRENTVRRYTLCSNSEKPRDYQKKLDIFMHILRMGKNEHSG
jgi:hypothetical protein